MEKALRTSFVLILLVIFSITGQSQTVVQVPVPTGTSLNLSSDDSRTFALTLGGLTTTYANASWPSTESGCYYFGLSTTLSQVINAYNTSSPNTTCANMSDLTYSSSESNPSLGKAVFTGGTTYHFWNENTSVWVNQSCPVRQTIIVKNTATNAPISFSIVSGILLWKIPESSFTVQTYLETNYNGSYIPSIALFNNLHTDQNTSICTSWNGVNFYQVPFYLSFETTDPNCYNDSNGSITTTIHGGISPLTFLWNTSSPGSINQSGLKAGDYHLRVGDNNYCVLTYDLTLNQPDSLKANLTKTDILCPGDSNGTITTTPSGGTGSYALHWDNDADTTFLFGLPVGRYHVTLIDEKQCETSDSIDIAAPEPIAVEFVIENPICNTDQNGSVSAVTTGGTGELSFLWSTGDTTDLADSIGRGVYTVTITDTNNCFLIATDTLTPLSDIILSDSVVSASCFEYSDGAIYVNAFGGIEPYSYKWLNDSTGNILTGMPAGVYTLTVEDDSGCYIVDSFTVNEPPKLSALADPVDNSCYGALAGEVVLTVTGGTEPYTFLWANGAVTKDITDLAAGKYEVIVTDNMKCSTSAEATVKQPEADSIGFSYTVDIGNLSCTNKSSVGTCLWTFDDGEESQDVNPIHEYEANGTYQVCLVLTTSCDTLTACQEVVIDGITQVQKKVTSMKLYPNPADSRVTISWKGLAKAKNLSIHDALGREVLYRTVTGDHAETVGIDQLNPGVYRVLLRFADHTESLPLVITR